MWEDEDFDIFVFYHFGQTFREGSYRFWFHCIALWLSGILGHLLIDYDDVENSITNESHVPRTIANGTCTTKRKKSSREYRCGTGQTPSEGQVRTILTALEY